MSKDDELELLTYSEVVRRHEEKRRIERGPIEKKWAKRMNTPHNLDAKIYTYASYDYEDVKQLADKLRAKEKDPDYLHEALTEEECDVISHVKLNALLVGTFSYWEREMSTNRERINFLRFTAIGLSLGLLASLTALPYFLRMAYELGVWACVVAAVSIPVIIGFVLANMNTLDKEVLMIRSVLERAKKQREKEAGLAERV